MAEQITQMKQDNSVDLKNYPELVKLMQMVNGLANIKAWLDKPGHMTELETAAKKPFVQK